MNKECEWSEDDDCCWECSNCDIAWSFDAEGPEGNDVVYCPKCGSKILNFKHYYDEDGDPIFEEEVESCAIETN